MGKFVCKTKQLFYLIKAENAVEFQFKIRGKISAIVKKRA